MSQHLDARAAGAAAIWNWRSAPPDASVQNARRRRHGAIQAMVGGAAGGVLYALGHPLMAIVVWSIATTTLTLALVSPGGAFVYLERLAAWLGHVAGSVVTYILLVPLFYGFFTIFGLLLRAGSRDKLKRWFEPGDSYWHQRGDPERAIEHYERQF